MIKAIALSTVFAVVSVVSFASPVAASKSHTTKKPINVESPTGRGLCSSPGCPT